MTAARCRVAVLISGRGSNLGSLIEAARAPDFPAAIALVVSNRPGAPGLARAEAAGIEAVTIDHKAFPGREAFERSLDQLLRERAIDFVCLAGFMRVLTPWFVERWKGRMINIHPSLLPLFRGTGTHRQALEAGVREHGCTVHFVIPELDAGPVIAQATVPVLPDDTEDSLAARVLAEEHRLYPQALRLLCGGTIRLEGARVVREAGPDEENAPAPATGSGLR
jgi:phosphoribosylglycinamide formyltransferase-1